MSLSWKLLNKLLKDATLYSKRFGLYFTNKANAETHFSAD